MQKAYHCWDMGEYDKSHNFDCIWSIAQALETGERDGVGTMVNIQNMISVGTTVPRTTNCMARGYTAYP